MYIAQDAIGRTYKVNRETCVKLSVMPRKRGAGEPLSPVVFLTAKGNYLVLNRGKSKPGRTILDVVSADQAKQILVELSPALLSRAGLD